jgi:hypothetical protein
MIQKKIEVEEERRGVVWLKGGGEGCGLWGV